MAKAQPAPGITAATPVPHAPGVTYGQLCPVRRKHAGLLQPGTILARDGAWQRKAVVTHVVYGGSAAYGDGGTQPVFTGGLRWRAPPALPRRPCRPTTPRIRRLARSSTTPSSAERQRPSLPPSPSLSSS